MTWTSEVFGLRLEGDALGLGLAARDAASSGRPTVLRAVTRAELDANWPAGAVRLAEEHAEPGAAPRTIDEHPTAGWRLDAPGWGVARVAVDGTLVEGARDGAEAWRWQRFLVGRVLPFAAVASGLEVMHAAAVVVGGRALALTGTTGAGKSSVGAALAARGHALLTDDVLALELAGERVVAHPGPPVLALRDPETAILGAAAVAALGRRTGAGGGKTYVETPPAPGPCPLGRLVVLRRDPAASGLAVHELPADPRLLLGSLFVPEAQPAGRAARHLSLLAVLARDVPCSEAVVGSGCTAADVAEALA